MHKITRFSSLYTPIRNPKYSEITPKNLEYFSTLLKKSQVKTTEIEEYNLDFLKIFQGNSPVVLQPESVSEVSEIIKYCNANSLAISPQGGNTGLVGGSVPVHDEIILHMGKMNKILDIDSEIGVVKSECGVVLEELNNYCGQFGYIFPIDLGAKGSCQIGGNISTCAAGIRLLRYGSLHASVLGLEVVTGTGEILDWTNTYKRQSNMTNLSQIFIGNEGTLGIITKASVLLSKKSKSENLVFLACETFENSLEVLRLSKKYLSEIVSAFELQDRETLEIVLENVPGTIDPFGKPYKFYLLIECSGANPKHDNAKLEMFLEEVLGKFAVDGVMPQGSNQFSQLWKLRESCGYAVGKPGYCFMYDISLHHKYFYKIVEEIREAVGDLGVTCGFGHLGDCNLHLTVTLAGEKHKEKVHEILERVLFPRLEQYKASISAEHGIGLQKVNKLAISRSPIEIRLMGKLKSLFDPNGILNPYKVLPIIN